MSAFELNTTKRLGELNQFVSDVDIKLKHIVVFANVPIYVCATLVF